MPPASGLQPTAYSPAFNGQNTLTLALFVTRIHTDHPDDALATNHFTIFTNTLNTGANFHHAPPFLPCNDTYGWP